MAVTRKKKPQAKAVAPESIAPARSPSPRHYATWTPALVRSAIRLADSGSLEQAANLCNWLLQDAQIAGCLAARVDAVLGLPVKFEPAKTKAGETDEAITDALADDWSSSYPESELSQILTWGLLLGVTPARHMPEYNVNERIAPNVEFWQPSSLRQDISRGSWFTRDADGIEHEIIAGNGEWLLFTPYGKNRPYALGLWQSIALLAVAKQYAIQDWAKASEKSSMWVFESVLDRDGNPVVGTSDKQRQQLVDALDARGSDASVALPSGWQLKLLQSADSYHVYSEQIKMIDDAIAARIRGGNLTTQTTGGSLAAAQAQADNGDAPKLRKDSAALSTFLHDQSVIWYCAWNFGKPEVAPWPRWAPVGMAKQVDQWTAYATVALANAGFDVDVDVLRDVYGLDFVTGYTKPIEPAGGGFGGGTFARAHGHVHARAASDPGQQYVDRSTAKLIEVSPLAVSAYDLMEVVAKSDTPEALRTNLHRAYADLDQSALEALYAKAFLLAEYAGRLQASES